MASGVLEVSASTIFHLGEGLFSEKHPDWGAEDDAAEHPVVVVMTLCQHPTRCLTGRGGLGPVQLGRQVGKAKDLDNPAPAPDES